MNGTLFEREAPNYSGATFPTPRAFQGTAHQLLRDGIRAGHKRQLLMSPTGSGKTFMALRLAHETLLRGRRALFIADRRTLIDQTSTTADRYGLSAHGVLMSQHWRNDPTMPFQIASAQTLARRDWPPADVIIVDECHTQLAVWVDYIMSEQCTAFVIGLSATPFSPGMGKIFTNLVNAATMAELTEAGVLVPLKVLSAKRANMEGAATSGGEWTDAAAGERGMEIVGDVVAEWLAHGENRKTIVFGSTIAHCAELCKQFNESGVMAQLFTSETTEDERKGILAEYRKPDTMLRVLISVEALAKGFDVPDVSCVVDCRPLRKSLSTAIQMWGRGLRSSEATGKTDCLLLDHCIASGQRVLTDQGLVAIEKVTLQHRLWDGHEFVEHKGVVSRGIRPIIRYAGLAATADHPVKTAHGWRTLGQCSDEQTPVVTTGVGRSALRERDGHFTGGRVAGAPGRAAHACALRVRHLWLSVGRRLVEFAEWAHEGLQAMQSAASGARVVASACGGHEAAMHERQGSTLQGLWRERDRVPFRLADHLRSLDRGELGLAGRSDEGGAGSEGQRRALRAGQSSLGQPGAEHVEHAGQQALGANAPVSAIPSRGSVCRCIVALVLGCWNVIRGNRRAVGDAIGQAEGQVWDVLDCGPRNSFTCEGLLVHNSGNIIRFADDYAEIFFNGLSALDAGEKLDKTIRKDDEEKTPKACPQCGFKPMGLRCISCGHEVQRASLIEVIPGHMQPVVIGKTHLADNHRHLYEQIVAYTRSHGKPETAKGRAWHLFKEIAGVYPEGMSYERTHNAPITRPVMNKIVSRNMAYSKRPQGATA